MHCYSLGQWFVDEARKHAAHGRHDEMIKHLKAVSLDVAMFLRVLESEKAALVQAAPKAKRKPRRLPLVRKLRPKK